MTPYMTIMGYISECDIYFYIRLKYILYKLLLPLLYQQLGHVDHMI